MNKKRGFALIEAIFMIVFLSVALLLVYKAFSVSFQDERKRSKYDNTEEIYETYFIKQYFEEIDILDYLATVSMPDGYLELTCSTITSDNSEYCEFLTSTDNFDVNKIYVTKYDMADIDDTDLDPTTIDYFNTLSSTDNTAYRLVVWFNNDEYASLKIGEPFYMLRVFLDGGTWNGISPQKLNEGDTTYLLNPTKAGYVFNGWYVSGTGSSVSGTTFTMGSEDTSIVANWTAYTETYSYTGSYQTFTAPATGYYEIDLWGASGGGSIGNSNIACPIYGIGDYGTGCPAPGSYTKGNIYLNKDEVLYIYVGGKGNDGLEGVAVAGGYNGGGAAEWDHNDNEAGGSGGGATDIRLVSGDWNNSTSLASRIMVAAGGGGADDTKPGGAGGDLISEKTGFSANATQISGYQFGIGGSAVYNTANISGGGGGGGYYGGGAVAIDSANYSEYGQPGMGGSSFISGYAGVSAITSVSSTTATYNTIHYSNDYFINGEMTAGTNYGNGSATITYLGEDEPTRTNTNLDGVRYIKDCINGSTSNTDNAWVELQAIYAGVNVAKNKTVTGTVTENSTHPYSILVDGAINNYALASGTGYQCLTVDLGQEYDLDEIAVWHYWFNGRTFYSNTTYVSDDNSNWTAVIATEEAETSNGKRVNAWDS
ncbi:MAG TPA: glycine-rich protein [Bacilli bacterium]|nr:glycine-rich protein [Bacilli bacterium]